MSDDTLQRAQAAAGLEQLASLVRAHSWRNEGMPALSPTQGAILRMLATASDGLRAKQIAARLDISPASLSDSLKTMQAKGWIARRVDPHDRRAAIIHLSRQGRALAARMNHPERGMAVLLQGLESADVGALLRLTQLLVSQAQQLGMATGMRTCLGCKFFRPYASNDTKQPHFCAFLGTPFGDAELRADCTEQSPADEALHAANRERFRLQQISPP